MTDELNEIAARAYTGLDDLWIENRLEEWIAPRIAEWCEGRTLDLGYGSGTMAKALRDNGVDIELVVEGSAKLAVDAAEAGFLSLCTTFEEAEFITPFDTVLCLFVLEHVEDPVAVLKRAHGWLKPGGTLIVAVPNATSIHRVVGSLMTGEPPDTPSERDLLVGHRRVFTTGDLVTTVRAAGFEWDYGHGWFLKPVPNSMMVGWTPALIDALCEVGAEGDWADCANILGVAIA